MKVLLLSPKKPDTFWNLQETVNFYGKKTLAPPLGLITVAALLPREWDCRLVDTNVGPATEEDWRWADLVMLSGMLIQKQSMLNLIREAKQRGKTVVAGGPYPTSLPQEVLEAGADFLVRGEAEAIMPQLLAAIAANQPGVIEETGKPDLTKSPIPRFDLLNLENYVTIGIQTSRGCPFNCEFCDVVNLYGRKPRHKTPDQVIAEMDALYSLGWRKDVFICDDNFVGYREQCKAILQKLVPWSESHGEPFGFMTQTSINLGQDPELIDLLTAANFGTVFIGVESPDEDILNFNRKYQNIKNPPGQSLTNICANGLTLMASFVFGFDNEKPGLDKRICAFVEQHHLPIIVLNILNILPNTNLWERLQKEGRLIEGRNSGDTQDFQLNYVPTRPAAEILGEFRATVDRLYEPSRYLKRAYQYFLAMRPTRRAQAKNNGGAPPTLPKQESRAKRTSLKDLKALWLLVQEHGLQASYRAQFWRQLFGIYRHNPSRLIKYLICISMGENMFRLREKVLQQIPAS